MPSSNWDLLRKPDRDPSVGKKRGTPSNLNTWFLFVAFRYFRFARAEDFVRLPRFLENYVVWDRNTLGKKVSEFGLLRWTIAVVFFWREEEALIHSLIGCLLACLLAIFGNGFRLLFTLAGSICCCHAVFVAGWGSLGDVGDGEVNPGQGRHRVCYLENNWEQGKILGKSRKSGINLFRVRAETISRNVIITLFFWLFFLSIFCAYKTPLCQGMLFSFSSK